MKTYESVSGLGPRADKALRLPNSPLRSIFLIDLLKQTSRPGGMSLWSGPASEVAESEIGRLLPVKVDEKVALAVLPLDYRLRDESLRAMTKARTVRPADRDQVLESLLASVPTAPRGTGRPEVELYIDEGFAEDRRGGAIAFAAGTGEYIRLPYLRFQQLTSPRVGLLSLPHKVKLKGILPTSARSQLELFERCILGVSLDNMAYTPGKLAGLASFIGKHQSVRRCLVLLGDYMHRLTLQIRNPALTEDRALATARRTADNFVEQRQKILARHLPNCQIEYCYASRMIPSASYTKFYEGLRALDRGDERFHASVEDFARYFLGRQNLTQISEEPRGRSVRLSAQYLLEELAIFTCLAKECWECLVYPGTLGIFTEIAENQHPGVPKELRGLASVWLDL